MHSQNKCRQFTIWQMALYPDPTHLCLRGWYSSLGGKSVYIYYAIEAQPILYSSNRCNFSWGLLVFLAEKCQTIMLSNKWPQNNASYYWVLGASFTKLYKMGAYKCVSGTVCKTLVMGWSLFCGSWSMHFHSDSSYWDPLELFIWSTTDCFLIDRKVAPSLSCLFL